MGQHARGLLSITPASSGHSVFTEYMVGNQVLAGVCVEMNCLYEGVL